MKKQVAVRFSHSTFSVEMAKELGYENLIIPNKRNNGTFDIVFPNTDDVPEKFNNFSQAVQEKTNELPNWFACFGIDLKDPIQASA